MRWVRCWIQPVVPACNAKLAWWCFRRPVHPNYSVSCALGLRLGKRDGMIIHGCGMDMGFDIAYRLGFKLYGDGYVLKHEWL